MLPSGDYSFFTRYTIYVYLSVPVCGKFSKLFSKSFSTYIIIKYFVLSLYLKFGYFIFFNFEWIILLCSDFHFFKISIICVAAGSLIIAPKKIIFSFFPGYSWDFSGFSFFSSFILLCLVMAFLLLCDGSSFEVWAWRVHFQKLLWVSICIYCLFYLLILTIVHLASSKWLSD